MKIENWGIIPYQEAAFKQLDMVNQFSTDTLVLCSHHPVVTVGRGTKPGDIFGWSGEIIETPRGGRATYHGPSQVIAYPIIDLSEQRKNFPAKDLHGYLRSLENAIVATLQEFGITSEARTIKAEDGSPSLTGVWVIAPSGKSQKIASIGVAVKKWITYHGLAINVLRDKQAFLGINPCGFQNDIMTSMEDQIGSQKENFKSHVEECLRDTLKANLLRS